MKTQKGIFNLVYKKLLFVTIQATNTKIMQG